MCGVLPLFWLVDSNTMFSLLMTTASTLGSTCLSLSLKCFKCSKNFRNLLRDSSRERLSLCKLIGGEYTKLHSFFKEGGISHHVSCPHAHQQNGSAERKHRHIIEVGLSLLSQASMPLKYWDKAFLTATYLINRMPSKVIQGDTPFFCVFNEIPNYNFMRPFGSACWPNLRPYNSHKLQFQSKQCIFTGYSNLHKGYKCLDYATGRLYISRDVVFDEQVFPFAKFHPNAGPRLRAEVSLHPTLFPTFSQGCKQSDNHVVNISNPTDNVCEDVVVQQQQGMEHQADSPIIAEPVHQSSDQGASATRITSVQELIVGTAGQSEPLATPDVVGGTSMVGLPALDQVSDCQPVASASVPAPGSAVPRGYASITKGLCIHHCTSSSSIGDNSRVRLCSGIYLHHYCTS
jgi:hypothetical protein